MLEPEVTTEVFNFIPETNIDIDFNDFKIKGSTPVEEIPFFVHGDNISDESLNDFTFKPNIPLSSDEPFLMNKIEVNAPPKVTESESQQSQTSIEEKEQTRVSNERIQRLKELSMKIRTPEGLSEIEKQPAYIRRNMPLSDITPSSESEISRYTLPPNEDNSSVIKQNNKFLHDNVD